MRLLIFLVGVLGYSLGSYAAIYNCIDAQGQPVFSDMPCVMQDTSEIGSTTTKQEGGVAIEKMPVVANEQAAARIRYQLSPSEAQKKYCAKYDTADREKLIKLKKVVLGMYLADVIKVWGAPISTDGNQVTFQNGNEGSVSVSLIEGCVIDIHHPMQANDEEVENEADVMDDTSY